MQKCAPAFEDIRHIGAEGLGADQNDGEENRDLENPVTRHGVLLELLRAKQGVNQVCEQEDGRNSGDDIVHGWFLLEFVARLGECPRGDEEQNRNDDVEEIEHMFSADSTVRCRA